MSGIAYHEPSSVREACELMAIDGSRLLAGGTALALLLRQGLISDDRFVSLGRVQELRRIETSPDRIAIGAMVTHEEVATSPVIRCEYPALAAMFASVASPRIRNAGTVGGNLAHGDPHLDPPVALLALGATVIAQSVDGSREIGLDEFFVDYYETTLEPTEVLTTVAVPRREVGTGFSALKFLSRSKDDYATVDVAVWLRLDGDVIGDVRIGLGSVGPTAYRAVEAEATLKGCGLGDDARLATAGASAAASSDPESDVRGSAAYKRELLQVLVPRTIREAARSLGEVDVARQRPTSH
jgi:aerobic carbon-monoxide dehydrogenase medium subunit